MDESKWIWMPHAGHFCGARSCNFRLNTYVGGYIVSTIGEYVPGSYCSTEWEEIGSGRLYETMVFKAKKIKEACCSYEAIVSEQVDFEGYNDAGSATKGHMRLCKKWVKRGVSDGMA